MSYLPITSANVKWLRANSFNLVDDQIIAHTSLPNNFAIANKDGVYSWFVKNNRFNWDPVNGFASSEIHPAFIINALAAPVNAAFTAGAGTLAIGTYYYRVTALTLSGETAPSAETSLALTAVGGVNVNWSAVPGATGYKVYGRSTGAELFIAQVAAEVTTYLDNGSITPTGAMPTMNTTGEKEIYIGKYTACLLDANGNVNNTNGIYAGSRPFVQQVSSINFDDALAKCATNNGGGITGFHLMTNAEWAALQIRSIAGATQPYGNTNYGRDDRDPSIVGRCYTLNQFGVVSDQARWLTGSGGIKTSHNGQADGVFDLAGNVWEWIGGMRLNNGEINILINNNAGDATKDQTLNSAEWKAILRDGTLVAPGTANTLKFDAVGNITIAVTSGSGSHLFETQTLVSPVVDTDAGIVMLKKLGIIPYTTGLYGDYFWYNNGIESIPLRGGFCDGGSVAGVSALSLLSVRGDVAWNVGFRLAFAL